MNIAKRVLARYLKRAMMEHDSPEALKKYLHDHPGAERSNHTVKKPEKEEKGKEDDDGGKKSPKKFKTEKEWQQAARDLHGEMTEKFMEAESRHDISGDTDSLASLPDRYVTDLAKKTPRIKQLERSNGWPGLNDSEEASSFFRELHKELSLIEKVMKDNKDQTDGRVPAQYTSVVNKVREKAQAYERSLEKLFQERDRRKKELAEQEPD